MLRRLFGTRPRALLYVTSPTLMAIAMDVMIRGKVFLAYPPLQVLNYTGSSLAAAGFWGGPLWLISKLFLVRGRRRIFARVAIALFFGLFILPLAIFCFGGQALYHRVFEAYMARDTVRLGMALRGTLGDWLLAWGGPFVFVALLAIGIPITWVIFTFTKKAAPSLKRTWPLIPVLAFLGCAHSFWIDFVESRSLQAAPPDTCFIHGVIHALHDGVTGKGWVRRGISLRTPAPLPPVPIAAHRPNVLLILTESMRADATCSDPPPKCKSQFLDPVTSDRIPLGLTTTQTPGTFGACMLLWTGMPPNVDFKTAHSAPIVWEVAKAAGYRTAYITSQNLRYDDFGAFVRRASIDVKVSAMELGHTADPMIGAPDELATPHMLDFIKSVPSGEPYFGVLHFSNTHAPYRVASDLQPNSPHSDNPTGDIEAFHNQYRNSVLMQERTLAAFLKQLRALPSYADTVVLFVSDHGEQFAEHGSRYHNHSLFDEELRIPGWLIAGDQALTPAQITALKSWSGRRAGSQDLNATIIDLFGVTDARPTFPYASLATGHSLLRPPGPAEPLYVATSTAVWEADDPKYGVIFNGRKLVTSQAGDWSCYVIAFDPKEGNWRPNTACGSEMVNDLAHEFPGLKLPH
ncbi:MAG: sulfatase-like hydrolase/transferase [Polyangiaceae bacterium]